MITIISKEEQAHGAFDQGKILERKPLGFPQDGGKQKPYSTLFYWAHAWSDKGGLIGEHPHKGFEIMSFVLSGEIEHYDSQLKGWRKLQAGDVQIIRAGSGITHAEKILANTSIFQIWFDPDLSKTLSKPASYNDYEASVFSVKEEIGMKTKVMVGDTPITMDSKVNSIREITFSTDKKQLPLDTHSVYSLFVLAGELNLSANKMNQGDFAILKSESVMDFSSIKKNTRIFVIDTPLNPRFATYTEMMSKR